MVLAKVLLLMCLFCVVCVVPVCGRVKRIKSTPSKKGNPTTASPPAVSGNDEVLTKLKGFFDGKDSGFGQKGDIGVPKVPSSWGEVSTTTYRFIKRLRKDPFTRTLAVISANIVLLVLIYAALFVANIHLALKHRRAIAAASNGNSLLTRTRSVKIEMPRTSHKDIIIPHTAKRSGARKLCVFIFQHIPKGTPATNLDGGLLHSQKKELKGKLSFNTTASEADIPRLADQSTSDVLTSSGHSTSRSTHLNVESDTSHEHIVVEVHEEDVDKARSLNTADSRETLPQSGQVPSADQQEAVVDSPKQLRKKDSP
uniref:Conserved plasma membrane protein n=1 Tax=Ascaris lumbricoides TaxID=6252 RepID=A0A0M3HML0_ASCLU